LFDNAAPCRMLHDMKEINPVHAGWRPRSDMPG
jgi:hypothetical protein